MQVKIEDKSSVKKVLSFEIPKEDVTKELNVAYKDLKKKVDVKGFRTPQYIEKKKMIEATYPIKITEI